MDKQFMFFSYLLEMYATHRKQSAKDILKEWDKNNITQEIYDGYWIYHMENIENAFSDIDSLIKTGQHAY